MPAFHHQPNPKSGNRDHHSSLVLVLVLVLGLLTA
jgi:hypothetical protein